MTEDQQREQRAEADPWEFHTLESLDYFLKSVYFVKKKTTTGNNEKYLQQAIDFLEVTWKMTR